MSNLLGDLLSINSLDEYDEPARLEILARLIDVAGDESSQEGIDHAFCLIGELKKLGVKKNSEPLFHYFCANAWSAQYRIKCKTSKSAWDWQAPELGKQLFELRSAITSTTFENLVRIRKCQILTNTGNLLNTLGRTVEAIEYWERALSVLPVYGMALGNLGYGLVWYARLLGPGHESVAMFSAAHDYLTAATEPAALFESPAYESARSEMQAEADRILDGICLEKVSEVMHCMDFDIGHGAEKDYREWCIDNVLFLNPINDILDSPLSGHDTVSIESIISSERQIPREFQMFATLKQEFVSARYLLYESMGTERQHFSDRSVRLPDCHDYTVHALSIEKLKSAFRVTYSTFDKIAHLINLYWKLGIDAPNVSLRNIWTVFERTAEGRKLRPQFDSYENLPLRGLYWLSKDLLDSDQEQTDVIEPDARAIRDVRNFLEHRFLRVLSFSSHEGSNADNSEYQIPRNELEAKTIRLMKLSRAAILYVVLAVRAEERHRAASREVSPMSINIGALEDDIKGV